jgi:hypothetical protein
MYRVLSRLLLDSKQPINSHFACMEIVLRRMDDMAVIDWQSIDAARKFE